MKLLTSTILLLSLAVIALTSLMPQDDSEFLKMLKKQFQTQSEIEEKIYIHTDRTFFYPDEQLWFRLSVLNGNTHEYSQLSSLAYAELSDPKGNVVHKWTLNLNLGVAKGDFHFSNNLPGGIYKLRAYTLWMKNFGEETFYEKEITLQKVVKPRLLMKMDFPKRAHSKGDTVRADLTVRDAEDMPFADKPIQFQVNIDGKKWLKSKAQTDKEGKSQIVFQLPQDLNTTDVLLNVLIPYEGSQESISRNVPVVLNKIKLDFLPEGGDYIAGTTSRIAFKAINEFGKGADIAGRVLDDLGNEVATFESFHLGMGVFEMQTQIGRNYTAELTSPSGITEQFALPEPLKKGYLLKAETTSEKLNLSYYASEATQVDIVGRVRDQLVYTKTLDAQAGWNQLPINTQNMPVGIVQFTLFDKSGEPQAERLVFLNAQKQLQINITTDKKQYKPREKVQMKVKTTDADGNPVPTSLSLAVTDDKLFTFADDKQHNIASWLLLGSDLKGKIEEPEFYFRDDEPKAAGAIDLLMLTQGWRRFEWKDMDKKTDNLDFAAETKDIIVGKIVDKRNLQGVEGSLWVSVQNSDKMAEVKTDAQGKFAIMNSDVTRELLFLYESPHIEKENTMLIFSWQDEYGKSEKKDEHSKLYKHSPKYEEQVQEKINKKPILSKSKTNTSGNLNLNESISELRDVIVDGYIEKDRPRLTGSSALITSQNIESKPIYSLLEGRPSSASKVRIRGSSSISVSNEPLYVVNGVQRLPSEVQQMIANSEVENVQVLTGGSATALYGSRASSGVVIVNSNSKSRYDNHYTEGEFRSKRALGKYKQRTIKPKYELNISKGRIFYLPDYTDYQEPKERDDFRNTIYWNPLLQTDKEGVAEVTFFNSDANTVFRAVAEGISIKGEVGRKEFTYSTAALFSIDTKMPAYLTYEDKIKLPIILKNKTEERIEGILKIKALQHVRIIGDTAYKLRIEPQQTKTIWVDVEIQNIAGSSLMSFSFEGSGYQERIRQEIQIQPKGFPRTFSVSGDVLQTDTTFIFEDAIEGSLTGKLTAYPNIIGQLMDGIEGMIREPYGCFEQTSSVTYPNVLALDYIQKNKKRDPETVQKALDYIDEGYKRLLGYEVKGTKGFSLFGKPEASTWLSAYGLMEFMDMNKVYSVDDKLIERTINFLLSRRIGNGEFQEKNYAYLNQKDNNIMTTAYTVYALSGFNKIDIQKEYEYAYNEALESENIYRMALLTHSSTKLNKIERAETLLQKLDDFIIHIEDSERYKNIRSITYGYGNSTKVEVASLLVMAILEMPNLEKEKMYHLLKFIAKQRRGAGSFGSTRATILALKAIIAYSEHRSNEFKEGNLQLAINTETIWQAAYKENSTELRYQNIAENIREGKNDIAVSFANTDQAIPFMLTLEWYAQTPDSNPECEVGLETILTQEKVSVGETVRLTTKIRNKTDKGIPSTVALIGIPSGLSPQAWQLKKLVEEKVIDFYEFKDNYVVFYYVDMEKNVEQTIHLDLKAEIAGTYRAPASSAYLYYADEWKDWNEGTQISIE
ncbi:MAG: TonB-dependent receptor plug domain-containing protein [Bernardetiaceae bacterium]|nr:TonB-dependent receptor plug domain-containing protein [Bernardetiaceae bacterium]